MALRSADAFVQPGMQMQAPPFAAELVASAFDLAKLQIAESKVASLGPHTRTSHTDSSIVRHPQILVDGLIVKHSFVVHVRRDSAFRNADMKPVALLKGFRMLDLRVILSKAITQTH